MQLKFTVTGMTCAACSARVEKVTKDIEGVQKAEVNLLGGTMTVEAAEEMGQSLPLTPINGQYPGNTQKSIREGEML